MLTEAHAPQRAPEAGMAGTKKRVIIEDDDARCRSTPRPPTIRRRHDSAPAQHGGGKDAMEYFVQQLINGLALGSIYGLIAIGYTMVYGIIGMINFAHGDIFMVGAFLSLIAIIVIGVTAATPFLLLILALIIVVLIAMAIAGMYGWVIERIAYRPLRGSFRL